LCELSAQRIGLHEVGESSLSVDLNDRQQLAVSSLELGVTGDVDLLELKRLLDPYRLQHAPRGRAQVALGRVEESDANYGYKPRVIVASETRCTASP
jgi:hypothetical protein